MRRFIASNSLAILSFIAVKNSQRESREGQGARVHQSSFCPRARGWLSPALKRSIHFVLKTMSTATINMKLS